LQNQAHQFSVAEGSGFLESFSQKPGWQDIEKGIAEIIELVKKLHAFLALPLTLPPWSGLIDSSLPLPKRLSALQDFGKGGFGQAGHWEEG
jgi:hypothetical protein